MAFNVCANERNRLLPNRTLTPDAATKGAKKPKERLTLLLLTNATGSDRYMPMVIGTSKSPRCLKNINMTMLGVVYEANKTAWMTGEIFLAYVIQFDRYLGGACILCTV